MNKIVDKIGGKGKFWYFRHDALQWDVRNCIFDSSEQKKMIM